MTKAKSNNGLGVIDEMKASFLEQAADLWDAHKGKFLKVVAGSEEQQINLTFTAAIDLSESAPTLKTVIRFSETFTDKREEIWPSDPEAEEPGQLVDATIIRESTPKKPRKKKDA